METSPTFSAVYCAKDGTHCDLTQPDLWTAVHIREALNRRGFGPIGAETSKEDLLDIFRSTLLAYPQRKSRLNRFGRKLRQIQQKLNSEHKVPVETSTAPVPVPMDLSASIVETSNKNNPLKRKIASEETDLAKIVINKIETKVHSESEKTLTVVKPKTSNSEKISPKPPKIRRPMAAHAPESKS